MQTNKTKALFYRRLLLAYLIDNGINTVPKIMETVEIPRRTAQDSISALKDLDIICSFKGALKDGVYIIESWGGLSPNWIADNITRIKSELGYK